MLRMKSRSRPAIPFAVLLSAVAIPAFSGALADYAGQYVLRLGGRNFMVLNLRQDRDTLTGSLSRPRHASLGASFSDIGSEIITETIRFAAPQQDHLHLVAQNPAAPSDTDAFDLTLVPPGHGSLQASGVPLDPWVLTRVPVSPTLSVASDWDAHATYYPDEIGRSNPDMQRIMDEDQKPRQSADMSHADWPLINKQDEDRRKQVRELLSRGALHSGKDFLQAAFVFQHGSTPDDYLLAHTLAMIAVARGNSSALWIATATLDRYLNSIDRPQIYGTQFHVTKDTPWTQEPYNRTLITDELRRQLGVPSRAAQQKQLEGYRSADKH